MTRSNKTINKTIPFDDFVRKVRNEILYYLPPEYMDAQLSESTVRKLNSSYRALNVMKPGQLISPSVNLEELYTHLAAGASFQDVMDMAAEIIQTAFPEMDNNIFFDYDLAKSHLVIHLSNYEKNREVLEDVPYTKVNDLAITYHLASISSNGEIHTAMVSNKLMEDYGISKEQLHMDALRSSPHINPLTLESYFTFFMKEICRVPDILCSGREYSQRFNKDMDFRDFYILSSRMRYGASALFYPDIMRHIGEIIGGDYYIFPGSVNEFIIAAHKRELNPDEAHELVSKVEDMSMGSEDWLTDTVYHYSRNEGIFESMEEYDARKKGTAAVTVP